MGVQAKAHTVTQGEPVVQGRGGGGCWGGGGIAGARRRVPGAGRWCRTLAHPSRTLSHGREPPRRVKLVP
ncbi:hypothetical protein GCM10010328_12640 [Streptomyces rubiginosohelvolus]|uniref:Uncharacterized protein n=1 Tax=Streptomyces rubiginosohelvolus TaxID=67362 RepID=A0ABQ3BEE6_9ACTN|nr:hypothetical protein GCM10010328_12640 [Streptomyces pluricolorescens]